MKIGVVGCGALGSFYGAKLCQRGAEVHFLLRSDYDVVRRQGVRIESVEGNFEARPACARSPAEIGLCDLVLIGLKTTANAEFGRLLPALVGPATSILTLQNGLGNEEALAGLFGAERILGGLCFVCLNRVAPGHVVHSAHGKVDLGEFGRRPQARTHEYARQFREAGVRCDVTENLAKAHWQKLVWNVPFNGLGVAGSAGYQAVIDGRLTPGCRPGACLSTADLLGDRRWRQLARDLMDEVISAAGHQGFEMPRSLIEERLEQTERMGAYKASTLLDFERGQPLELESLFFEPLRRAEASGSQAPRLRAMCRVLRDLDGLKRVAVE